MGKRPSDAIRVESEAGAFNRFNAIEVVNDISGPAQCGFDVGDSRSFETLEPLLKHGKRFRVYLNDQLRMTGRVQVNLIPCTAQQGSTINVVIRTKIAEATFTSADPALRVEKTSLRQVLVKAYEPLDVTEKDFVFAASAERDLMTGVGTKGEKAPANLEPMKVDQAKCNTPETIFDFCSRHLRRFGLMHWDAPDGRIYVGAPDDKQLPLYRFIKKNWPQSAGNNVLESQRIADWTDVPSEVRVYGGQGGRDVTKASIKSVAKWDDVAAEFYRPVILPAEGVKTQAQADAAARRERAQRSKRKDAYELSLDEWSFWTGDRAIPYAVNTTCDVDIDGVGQRRGKYFVFRVAVRYSAEESKRASVSVVAPGIMEI